MLRAGCCAAAVALALTVGGCGANDAPAAGSTSQVPVSSSAPAPGLVVGITIAGGTVTPTNATLQAKLDEPITLRVDSDVADELHVHSVPDHEFEVRVATGQSFEFTVDVPGSVAIELHHLNRTVATIQVRP
jgi:hypothetical protein